MMPDERELAAIVRRLPDLRPMPDGLTRWAGFPLDSATLADRLQNEVNPIKRRELLEHIHSRFHQAPEWKNELQGAAKEQAAKGHAIVHCLTGRGLEEAERILLDYWGPCDPVV